MGAISEFKNHPLTDFSRPDDRKSMEAALAKVRSDLGRTYPLRIGGESIETKATIASTNPSNVAEVVGRVSKADRGLAEKAIRAADAAFTAWSRTPAERRADLLFRTAAILRSRQPVFAACMIHEVGKSWAEADGDTAEAIDFLEFYGREMLRLAGRQPLTRIAGEDNDLVYIPLGVGVVIPPWNFPLAILAGMTSAAIVTGNTVVLKPASTSPIIAAQFVRAMEEAGCPPGVLNFCPGGGGEIGDFLIEHPRTRFIAFTGSKEVGLRINERAAKAAPGQIWIKRVVAEMGGKDSIVVDETADLDAAADGIVAAAFGFQGQKCSACSRAIVVDRVYDEVLKKAVERTKAVTLGDPVDPSVKMGGVIDESAQKKILDYIDAGKKEGRLVHGGKRGPATGWFIEPTIVADVPPKAKISQEEIFGPVLAFIRAKDFDEALAIANNTEYGLTGSLYSKDPKRLERARAEFHVGNLYLNRKCTGALVGVHPFGGFNMSGTDSKAGGRDYLLLFLQAKAVSRKLP